MHTAAADSLPGLVTGGQLQEMLDSTRKLTMAIAPVTLWVSASVGHGPRRSSAPASPETLMCPGAAHSVGKGPGPVLILQRPTTAPQNRCHLFVQ